MGRSRRTIPEELLLLALDPATGTTAQPQSLDLGLAGAQLVELALAGRIAPDGDRIAVVHPRPTGDPTLASALELLRRRGRQVRPGARGAPAWGRAPPPRPLDRRAPAGAPPDVSRAPGAVRHGARRAGTD